MKDLRELHERVSIGVQAPRFEVSSSFHMLSLRCRERKNRRTVHVGIEEMNEAQDIGDPRNETVALMAMSRTVRHQPRG